MEEISRMESKKENIRRQNFINFFLTLAVLISLALLLGQIRFRIDLTGDKRYTLSGPSKSVLSDLENDVYIQVYLDGEMPVPLRRLRRSVMEILDEFRVASSRKVSYSFINPSEATSNEAREAQYLELYEKGLNPVNAFIDDQEGGNTRKLIFPGMIVNYNGIEIPVNFLKNNQSISHEQNILHSVEGFEYELIQTISTITSDSVQKVAFLEGQGEYSDMEVADITYHLAKYFTIDRGRTGGIPGLLDEYSAVIIAGPSEEFTEADKLVIDQYIMKGGKVLWLLEELQINTDSLATGQTAMFYKPLNIADQLFRYGVRINPEVIQDAENFGLITISVTTGGQKQIVPAPWLYYPLLSPSGDHSVTRNINQVWGRYVCPIDTVSPGSGIKKIPLLFTSGLTRAIMPPSIISLKEIDNIPANDKFMQGRKMCAVLLEGQFTSAFRNRMITSIIGDHDHIFIGESVPTRMIVVSDADIIRNDLRGKAPAQEPLPLGQDQYTGQSFGNRDFIINCVNYLVDDKGLLELRSREIKMRLLDKNRVRSEKLYWQLLNMILPVMVVILSGVVFNFYRKRKYSTR